MSPYKIIIVKTLGKSSNIRIGMDQPCSILKILGKSSNIRIGMDQPCSIIFVNTTNGKVGHERYI